jgi:hypothetical protein
VLPNDTVLSDVDTGDTRSVVRGLLFTRHISGKRYRPSGSTSHARYLVNRILAWHSGNQLQGWDPIAVATRNVITRD